MADSIATVSIILGVLLLGLIALLIPLISSKYWEWYIGLKYGARLPKGSFGLPVIGETLVMHRDPLGFAVSHQKRYGSIFKSNVILRKTIIGTTPNFAKFVVTNCHLFRIEYPKSVEFLFPQGFQLLDGPLHATYKTLVSKSLQPAFLRTALETHESIVLQKLASWEQRGSVLGREAGEEIAAELATYITFGVIDGTPEGKLATKNLRTMVNTIASIPLNLPGTAYNKGLKAKAEVTTYLGLLLKKKQCEVKAQSGILGDLIHAQTNSQARGDELQTFRDQAIIDSLIGIWVGAYKTTATTLTWALKFLVDFPDVFKRVQGEQEEILKSKDPSFEGPRLTWEDTRKMVYTAKFFNEVQRTISIVYMLPRTAVQDVVYDGVLVPKGWQVLPLINRTHSDPAYFPDPRSFNPDRFDTAPKAYTYIPFGAGPHRCPGEEVAKLLTLINIHHLTTTYRYERLGPDQGMKHDGFPTIAGGYPIKVCRRN